MSNEFVPRLTKPEANNKYYNTKANGGYSSAIKGNPTDKDCDVLSNCVGYAYGRFNEIGGLGICKYLKPVNAENFIQNKGTLETGMVPKLGACMVWQKGATLYSSDGVGHVAIVEKIVSDSEVVTSESDWGGKPFYTTARKKGSDGNWGYSGKFLGFIYNPAPCCNQTASDEKTDEIKIGDVINFVGTTHYLNPSASSGAACTKGFAKVTKIEKGKKHPYHIVGEYHDSKNKDGSNAWGWVDEKDIKVISKANDISANIKSFLEAACMDGIRINWSETPSSLATKCLVQEWKDRVSRYPNLTKLAQNKLGILETGVCDSSMSAKIKEYQKKCNLVADGGIGRGTWEYLLGIK